MSQPTDQQAGQSAGQQSGPQEALGKIIPKKLPAGSDGKPIIEDDQKDTEQTQEDTPQQPVPKKSKPQKWGSNERQFLPAALEIMETPANPAGRILALSLAGFFSIALLWSIIGEVDVVAVATGKIVPAGGVKKIQALEIGTVRAIHVRDGQRVKAGDVLIELDPTESEVDKGQMLRQRRTAKLDIDRLTANLRGVDGKDPNFQGSADSEGLMYQIATQQLDSDLLSYQAQTSALDAEYSKLQAEKAGVSAEKEKLVETLPLIVEREEALHALVKKGISPKPNWLEVKQLLIETRHNINIQDHRLSEATASMGALEVERKRIKSEAKQQILDELVEARDNYEAAVLALRKARKKETQRNLLSPVDGVVQQLTIHTVGGVASPAEPLMLIVPDNAPLEIQAQILNKDAGFVEADQIAEIKIDSFPFTKYGMIDGHIRQVSRDAIVDEELGPVFDARVHMDKKEIYADGRLVPLTPGMTVSVEVKTGKRQIIEFLLSPVMRYQNESLRER